MDKDAFYFPHFANARHDRKIKRLRKQLGVEGYGIYFMILEILREQTDFKYPVEDIDLIADEIQTSDAKVEAVIKNYSLFKIDEDKFFSSKLIQFLNPYLEQKKRNKIGGIKGNLIKYKKLTKEEADKMTEEEIVNFNEKCKELSLFSGGESGSDRNKVNKSKENKINNINNTDKINFDEFWNLYDKKVGKKDKISKKWDKLKKEDQEKVLEHVKKYKQSQPDKQYRKNPETYFNNESWNDEIIENSFNLSSNSNQVSVSKSPKFLKVNHGI